MEGYRFFRCTELLQEIDRREFKKEAADMGGFLIAQTFPYMQRQAKIIRQHQRRFVFLGCDRYDITELRKAALK